MRDLSQVPENNYEFNAPEFVKKGWNIMNTQLGSFVGMTVLFLLIQLVLSMIPFLNLLAGLVSNVFYAGYFIYCRNILLNKQQTGDFFKGFDYLGNIILYGLVYFLMVIPFIILFFAAVFPMDLFLDMMSENISSGEFERQIGSLSFLNGGLAIAAFLVIFIGMIYLSVSYLYVIPLIVDAKLGFWEAMELSRKTVGKHFFNHLLWLIIGGIIVALGVGLTCGLGILFMLPITYCVIFAAYNEIFKPYQGIDENDIDAFGETRRDVNSEAEERDAPKGFQ